MALQEVFVKNQRIPSIVGIAFYVSNDLVRGREEHTAFVKVIVSLTIPELSDQFGNEGYLIEAGHVTGRKPTQVELRFRSIQQTDQRMIRPRNSQHAVYFRYGIQCNNFLRLAFHAERLRVWPATESVAGHRVDIALYILTTKRDHPDP
jgi:hypothetical protein